jgi:CRP-like cAMP-binding protein
MSIACFPKQNQVLAAVPEDCYARLLPDLERIGMPLGTVLHESDTDLSHIYFPTTSIVSLLQVMDDAACAGIAMVGNEGLVGLALFIGDAATANRAVVQCAGEGYRIKSRLMRGEIDRAGPMLDLLLIHTNALIAQMVNMAACNRNHSLEQRFCRWLLSTLHRQSSKQIGITQELLADVLGARLDSTRVLVAQLVGDGLIRHNDQWIQVCDRSEVEARACECYAVLTMEVDRLLTRAMKK